MKLLSLVLFLGSVSLIATAQVSHSSAQGYDNGPAVSKACLLPEGCGSTVISTPQMKTQAAAKSPLSDGLVPLVTLPINPTRTETAYTKSCFLLEGCPRPISVVQGHRKSCHLPEGCNNTATAKPTKSKTCHHPQGCDTTAIAMPTGNESRHNSAIATPTNGKKCHLPEGCGHVTMITTTRQ